MALTQTARSQLLAKIVPHTDQNGAVRKGRRTPTGMMDIGRGTLVIQPSTETTASHTGPLAQLTPEEQAAIGLDPVQEQQQAKPARRGRSSKAKAQPAASAVKVELVIPGAGVLPSQYAHCYEGKGIVVLGLMDMSYVPSQASRGTDGSLQGVVSINGAHPDRRYVFVGNEFTDNAGVRNIVLVEIPKEAGDDGQTK